MIDMSNDAAAEPITLTAGQMIRLQVIQEVMRTQGQMFSTDEMLEAADDIAVWIISGAGTK